MFRFRAGLIMLAVLIPLLAFAAPKGRNWQEGKVLESERTRDENGRYQIVVIEGEAHIYTAQSRPAELSLRHRSPNLTVNTAVKFVLEKQDLIIIDEDGREHKLQITKKVLKEPAQPK